MATRTAPRRRTRLAAVALTVAAGLTAGPLAGANGATAPELPEQCRSALDGLTREWPDVTQEGFDAYLAAVQEINAVYAPQLERVRALLARLREAEAVREAAQADLEVAEQSLVAATAARVQAEEDLAVAVGGGDPAAVTAAEEALADAQREEADALDLRDDTLSGLAAAQDDLRDVEAEIPFDLRFEIGSIIDIWNAEHLKISVPGLPPTDQFDGMALAGSASAVARTCPTTDLAVLGVLDGSGDVGGEPGADGGETADRGAAAPVATAVPARATFTG